MIQAKAIVLFVMLGTLMLFGWADTLTLRNNAEINGQVSYRNGAFTVKARYGRETATKTFDRSEVRTVEINHRDFNPGEPPADISVFEEHPTDTRNASHTAAQRKKKHAHNQNRSQSAAEKHSILNSGSSNPSTDDVVWLQDKTKITGRLSSINNGQLILELGNHTSQVKLTDVTTILVAPN